MDYLFDITSFETASGPTDTQITDLRESYNECRADLMDAIADELPIIADLTQSIANLQDYCHRRYREDASDTTYPQTSSLSVIEDDIV